MSMSWILAAALAGAGCPEQAQTLEAAAGAIERTYFDAASGRRIADRLRQSAREGRYAGHCSSEADFLDALNRDLDAEDGHFHVESRQPADGADWLLQWRADARRTNAGIREVSVLEGNVGYLRLASFHDWDVAGPRLTAAFTLLADTDALILDLRRNGGGAPDTAEHLVRAFVAPHVEGVQSIRRRRGTEPALLPRGGLPHYDKPLAILVDRRTGSASEFVAYSLQALGRARIVGTATGGAAHMIGDPIPLDARVQIAIPDASPINDTTGRNWEGAGVKPDVPGGDDPLFVARRMLMETGCAPTGER